MKIVLIRGAPRRNGATNAFADAFADGLRRVGADFCDVDLSAKKISPCRGCYACGARGECVIGDDMRELLSLLRDCDALACFSPVYFFGVSAQMKMFFDRCFPLVCSGEEFPFCGVADGFDSVGGGVFGGKKFLAFSVASGRMKTFGGVCKFYEFLTSGLGFDMLANIRRGEAVYFSDVKNNSVRARKILAAAEELGREFASGTISQETVKNVELPLAPDDKTFLARAKIYWNTRRAGLH